MIGTQAFLVTPGNHGDSPTPGVYVFDVAGASPTLRVSLATPGVAGGIAGDGTRAYVGDSASVLDVIA